MWRGGGGGLEGAWGDMGEAVRGGGGGGGGGGGEGSGGLDVSKGDTATTAKGNLNAFFEFGGARRAGAVRGGQGAELAAAHGWHDLGGARRGERGDTLSLSVPWRHPGVCRRSQLAVSEL